MASHVQSRIASHDGVEQSSYSLQILQQPRSARACGHGESDRRYIDPPFIIKLMTKDPNRVTRGVNPEPDVSFFMTCRLCDQGGTEYEPVERYDGQRTSGYQRLLGQCVCTDFWGHDQKGQKGWFFWFSELSVRWPGKYRLKVTVVKIKLPESKTGRIPEVGKAMSDIFEVFSAKDFEGYAECTKLTRILKIQGGIFSRAIVTKCRGDEYGNEDGTMQSNRTPVTDLGD
ncbi:hypothetical protein LZL87_014111 [Fusarium oxysporum]|nr:hypothetical protein LZL87_014111 [Fusarium oxysporum]